MVLNVSNVSSYVFSFKYIRSRIILALDGAAVSKLYIGIIFLFILGIRV